MRSLSRSSRTSSNEVHRLCKQGDFRRGISFPKFSRPGRRWPVLGRCPSAAPPASKCPGTAPRFAGGRAQKLRASKGACLQARRGAFSVSVHCHSSTHVLQEVSSLLHVELNGALLGACHHLLHRDPRPWVSFGAARWLWLIASSLLPMVGTLRPPSGLRLRFFGTLRVGASGVRLLAPRY